METEGRHATLVWQLAHPLLPATMDCVAIARGDGRVEVFVERGMVRQRHGVFGGATEAVRAALQFEAAMIAQGWQKVV